MSILIQFVLRVSFGLALAMAVTPPKQVTSGYYRNHLYVLLGLNVLATMVALSAPSRFPLWPPLAAAVLSYVGSVAWLYEKPRIGLLTLVLIAGAAASGAWLAIDFSRTDCWAGRVLVLLDPLTSGLVLGGTLAAMFLGHWYLNTPTMVLAPLQRLVVFMALAIVARAVVCAAGLTLELVYGQPLGSDGLLFVLLRWLSGIAGGLAVATMTWQTLKIPNTQSATGILYVGVIATFLGELTSLLLSTQTKYPL